MKQTSCDPDCSMLSLRLDSEHFLRLPDYSSDIEIIDAISDEFEANSSESEKEDQILCRQCRQVITDQTKGIAVNGSHRHTFANPIGAVYEIGCFITAKGCRYIGQPTGEFTWFKGFAWRIALCRSCRSHLGWLFIGPAYNTFNGLILDRLIFPESSPPDA